jgi:integrase
MYPKFTSPRILTPLEQKRLLRVVRAKAFPRDRALLSLALGTGLRLRELRGLNVGDISPDGKAIQWRVPLDPKITKGGRGGTAFLVAGVRNELRRYLRSKVRAKDPLEPASPLFPLEPEAPGLPSTDPVRVPRVAGRGGIRDGLPLPQPSPLRDHERLTALRRTSTSPSASPGTRAR